MRNLLRKLGLSDWQSLVWSKRAQGAKIGLLIGVVLVVALVLVTLGGCSAADTQRTLDGLNASQAEVAAAQERAAAMEEQARLMQADNEALLARARDAEAAAKAAGDAAAEAAAKAEAATAAKAAAAAKADAEAAGKLSEGAAKVQAQLAQAVRAIEAAKGPTGEITPEGAVAAGMTAAGSIWPGVGVILAALAPTVLSIGAWIRAEAKAKAARNAAEAIVKSVDVVRLAEPAVAEGMAKRRTLARVVLTDTAAKIVDNTRSS